MSSRKRKIETGSPKEEVKKTKRSKNDSSSAENGVKNMIDAAYKSFSLLEEPEVLPGRDDDRQEIQDWIIENVKSNTSSSMYISGRPGTGKTATITSIRKTLEGVDTIKTILLNCMLLASDRKQVYKTIGTFLKADEDFGCALDVTKYLHGRKRKITNIIFLDEIDQLLVAGKKKLQTELAEIFGWTLIKGSRVLVVGIANALDMTERIPLLSMIKCEPKLMHFRGYTKEEIVKIVQNRMPQPPEGQKSIFDATAISLLASTVASRSGDVRMLIDICRRAIQKLEEKIQQDPTSTTINISEMKSVCTDLLYDPVAEEVKSLSIHCQLLLVTLLLWSKTNKKSMTGRQLREGYKNNCKAINIPSMEGEVPDLCGSLEAVTLVGKQKDFTTRTFSLRVSEETLMQALKDVRVLSALLSK